jgi:hypothetical protein
MTWLRNIALLVAAAMIAWGVGAGAQAPAAFERTTLDIETTQGRHSFDIELALTPAQQSQGLMFRRKMTADAGMLFFHQRETVATMWMRNTILPLDMLFVATDGRIVHIVERTVPQSLTTISAGRPVRAVLELNAGTVRRLAVKSGDRLIHPLFRNAD